LTASPAASSARRSATRWASGAITGAISGAFNGIGAVPESPARAVTDRGSHGYGELRALAERLWALKRPVLLTKPQ